LSESIVIVGRKPVLEALKASSKVDVVFFLKGIKGELLKEITDLVTKRKISILELEQRKFLDLTRGAETTQGVAAKVQVFQSLSLKEMISYSLSHNKLLLALDCVQDPHNLGAIIRSAECAGVDGIILTTHNSAPLNITVFKTSAGAASHIKICEVTNLVTAIEECREEGFWSLGTALEVSKYKPKIDYNSPLLIVSGNEEKGLRRLVKEKCDFVVTIPMLGKIESLNVSVATGIVLFNVLRERGVW
jgi:23S rRNA (guanosine2251-2'-O)-methyltransferase